MSLLLYGIVAEKSEIILDSALQKINAAGLSAIVSVCDYEVSQDPLRVLKYGESIQHIHQQTTLIPVCYGSQFKEAKAVITHLEAQKDSYHARLQRLNNCEEMGFASH
jgi:Gas vesicle synthesis protein GvpL/GvpF